MASWMVHLRIADEILKRIEELDETSFVIGNIAPDSGVPNEDWSKYYPPKNISHFKTRPDDELFFDVDEFRKQYFSAEKIKEYDKRHYSFFLGYYVHLLSDIEWTMKIYFPNVSEEKAKEINKTKIDLLWENKADWYDLDFLYLEEHPDFNAFHIYETAKNLNNDYMDIFSVDAFENRRDYICGFYRSDNHGDLHREYKHLTPEQADSFVKETVDKIIIEIKQIAFYGDQRCINHKIM